MISARGTRAVSIKRKKSGLEFSIKGGKEHGIGVVVSWIKEGGAASSSLRLGDEILAVNSHSVQDLTHTQVVGLLKNAGAQVTLLVRPNQTLEDIFSNSALLPPALQDTSTVERGTVSPLQRLLPASQDDSQSSGESTQPLPACWSSKTDHKTGRTYYENHHTRTATWCDPRTRKPLALEEFKWNSLPPGWERFLDTQGDIYYVNHHTQTTHWDPPSGSRHQRLLQQLVDFIQQQTDKVKAVEDTLAETRKLLLEKNQKLSPLPEAQRHVEKKAEGESSADLIEDMMLLNEEAEAKEEELARLKKHLRCLVSILQCARSEDMQQKNEHREAAELALQLVGKLAKYQQIVKDLNAMVDSVGLSSKQDGRLDTPLQYMLQLPSPMEAQKLKETQQWVHVLPDKLTPKTTSELRLEVALLDEVLQAGQHVLEKLVVLQNQASSQSSKGGHGSWELLVEQLASLDFQPLQEGCTASELSFQEKLDRLLTF